MTRVDSATDAVFALWGTMHILWVANYVLAFSSGGWVLAGLYSVLGLLLGALFLLAAAKRLPPIVLLFVGVVELNQGVVLAQGNHQGAATFIGASTPELAPAVLLAILVVVTALFARAVDDLRNGEPIVPISIDRN